MTVIVAAVTTHRVGRKDVQAVTIASDSQITDGWEKMTTAYPKIWAEEGRLLFGAAGLVGAWQAVKYNVTWPHYPHSQEWEEWVVREVKPLVVSGLDCSEVLHRKRGVISMGMSLVVATGPDKLAVIDDMGGVVVPRSKCVAIGSGYAQALGSLGRKESWVSQDVINAALAATHTDLGCGPPIYWATTLDYEVAEADLTNIE